MSIENKVFIAHHGVSHYNVTRDLYIEVDSYCDYQGQEKLSVKLTSAKEGYMNAQFLIDHEQVEVLCRVLTDHLMQIKQGNEAE